VRRLNRHMAQPHTNRFHIHSRAKQVHSRGMSQAMRADSFGAQSRGFARRPARVTLDQGVGCSMGQRTPCRCDRQWPCRAGCSTPLEPCSG
jgi:hypothetical protein